MRVAVDARHLGRGRGVARYLESMLAELAQLPGDTEWLAVVPRGAVPDLPDGVIGVPARPGARVANAAGALAGRPRLDRAVDGADVVWLPAPAPVGWSREVPAVLTLHDISWEERPGDFTPYERVWHAACRPRRLARRASRVACVSEATRDAMLQAGWPVETARTVVIPEAPTAPDPLARPPRDGGYLLYVGALEPRKGIAALAAGVEAARRHGLTLPLVVVGEGRLQRELAGQTGIELAGPASDTELAGWYAGATALVLPSLLEGFGLTPVEAGAWGVPAVASDLPAIRESLGGSFLAVPPGDAQALGDALFAVATDSALRNRVGAEARETVSRLSWTRSARRLHELLAQAAEEKRT